MPTLKPSGMFLISPILCLWPSAPARGGSCGKSCTESLLLASLGGALGVAVAAWTLRVMLAGTPVDFAASAKYTWTGGC